MLTYADLCQAPGVDVIHCDLKPENVMLLKPDEHRIKVPECCNGALQPLRPLYIYISDLKAEDVMLVKSDDHRVKVS